MLFVNLTLSDLLADSVNPFTRKLALAIKLDRRTFFAGVDTFASLIAGIFIVQIPIMTERPTWIKDELGQHISVPEEILIISSFYANNAGLDADGENRKICSNLRDNILVAVLNPDDVVPHDIVVA